MGDTAAAEGGTFLPLCPLLPCSLPPARRNRTSGRLRVRAGAFFVASPGGVGRLCVGAARWPRRPRSRQAWGRPACPFLTGRSAMRPHDREGCHQDRTEGLGGPITRRAALAGLAAGVLAGANLPAAAAADVKPSADGI